jgi:hypothetical protein
VAFVLEMGIGCLRLHGPFDACCGVEGILRSDRPCESRSVLSPFPTKSLNRSEQLQLAVAVIDVQQTPLVLALLS